jgi:hypothetical protein
MPLVPACFPVVSRLFSLLPCCIAPASRSPFLFGTPIGSGLSPAKSGAASACIFVDIYKRMVLRSIYLSSHKKNFCSFKRRNHAGPNAQQRSETMRRSRPLDVAVRLTMRRESYVCREQSWNSGQQRVIGRQDP